MALWWILLVACVNRTPPPVEVEADAADLPMSPAQPGQVSEAAFKAMHGLKDAPTAALNGAMIALSDGSQAYLSRPDDFAVGGPAVLVIHEWWGLNKHIQLWADRLASEGYAVLAVDLYGKPPATTRDAAMELMRSVDEDAAQARLVAALAYLRTDPTLQAKRTGVIGWCFGGGWSLRTAILDPQLNAAVMYYGRLITEEKTLSAIEAPLLGIFGEKDQGIPMNVVEEFADTLQGLGKSITVHRYDAGHAFANPSGDRYDEASAADAWSKTRAFFAEKLKP